MKSIRCIGGVDVAALTETEALNVIHARFREQTKTAIFFANSNLIVKCKKMHGKLNGGSAIILNDGLAMDIASIMTTGNKFPTNLNGTDFCPLLLRTIGEDARVVLLGGKPGVASMAGVNLTKLTGIKVVGSFDGYQDLSSDDLIKSINHCRPNIVLVALGNPLQEEWIFNNIESLNSILFLGVGALMDYMAGNVKRSPLLIRKARLEWLHRLTREPIRLGRRYTLDALVFFYMVIRQMQNA